MSKRDIKTRVNNQLRQLGTFKEEYWDIIDIYCSLLHQYKEFERQFVESGFSVEEEYTNKAGATNMRKTPVYQAMETLRKDIVTYSDRLGLNPKAMESITAEKASISKLEQALMGL